MLPQPLKLPSQDFSRTIKGGKKAGSQTVVAYVRRAELTPCGEISRVGGPHFGLIVSKAVGNAVVRHRTARRLRHVCAALARSGAVPADLDVVLRALPRSGSPGLSSEVLERNVAKAIAKAVRRL